MSSQLKSRLTWGQSSGLVECYEASIITTWPEYIRGVVIAQESRRPEDGYTAYVEYFKYGVARQIWGRRVFKDRDQAKVWCVGEMTRLYGA